MTNAIPKGIKFRLTIARVETLAISAVAIITPATGDTVRPIEAESCIGSIKVDVSAPKDFVILGTKGPKAKKEALPLPISIEAKNIIIVIMIPIPTTPNPKLCEAFMSPSIKPKLIKPLAKISAVIIRVTTVLKIFPIPFQNVFKEVKTAFIFLVRTSSNKSPINKLINMAVVVSKVIGGSKALNIFENTSNKMIGNTGISA